MLAKRDAYYEHYWQCGACTKARSTGNTKECEQGIKLRQEYEQAFRKESKKR